MHHHIGNYDLIECALSIKAKKLMTQRVAKETKCASKVRIQRLTFIGKGILQLKTTGSRVQAYFRKFLRCTSGVPQKSSESHLYGLECVEDRIIVEASFIEANRPVFNSGMKSSIPDGVSHISSIRIAQVCMLARSVLILTRVPVNTTSPEKTKVPRATRGKATTATANPSLIFHDSSRLQFGSLKACRSPSALRYWRLLSMAS